MDDQEDMTLPHKSHRIWDMYDVVTNIVDMSTPQTRARFAQVNKAYSSIAINALWRNLNGIWPLVQLFSVDVEIQGPPDVEPGHVALGEAFISAPKTPVRTYRVGAATLAQWERFQHYATRVRSLAVNGRDDYGREIDYVQVMLSLHRQNKMRIFLPRLQDTSWTNIHRKQAFALCRLLTPNVRRLHLRMYPSYSSLGDIHPAYRQPPEQEVIQTALRCAPQLQSLSLAATMDIKSLAPLGSMNCVQTLDLSHSPMKSPLRWPTLASLECLSDLTINIHQDSTGFHPGFSSLRTLRIPEGHFLQTGEFLNSVQSTVLLSLAVASTAPDWDSHLDVLMTAITSRFADSIRWLSIDTSITGKEPDPVYGKAIPLVEYIRPLSSLKGLETFYLRAEPQIRSCVRITLSDDDFSEMMRSWPALTSLHILYGEGSFITSHALYDIARLHPKLEELVVPGVDLLDLSLSSDTTSNHKLKRVVFGQSAKNIRDPFKLARFLDTLFPKLDLGLMFQGASFDWEFYGWCTVKKLLNGYQSARELEREKAWKFSLE
ncbi:hypothetical protein CERSUDRAFT_119205 [Gelatoporia subvermispora B]|uniref:F-box domain-containing protein n=1 Tax=Ceriporiopsis subvermispora (strain B) TaxID=914234 RepID=M2QZD0_CERS8|nr:hypothetical protein CERSUDRAFT_119205 [Gelatoporia subvermispora B]